MTEFTLRLDRGKYFSLRQGECTPDDPQHAVRFWQGGTLKGRDGKLHRVVLPFDAHGNLVPDDGRTAPFKGKDTEGKEVTFYPLYDQAMREFLAAKKHQADVAKAMKVAAPEIVEDGAVGEDAPVAQSEDDVDLSAWLRGEANYEPFQVKEAFRRRYHHRVDHIREVVAELVLDEKIVPIEAVCVDLARFLPAPGGDDVKAAAAQLAAEQAAA